jgi:glutamine---fructose-6-phosphate transaminase (isomerizing)
MGDSWGAVRPQLPPPSRQVAYLNDYDVATVQVDRFDVKNLGSDTAKVQISRIEYSPEAAEKGAFPHFMLKEIHEQPQTVRRIALKYAGCEDFFFLGRQYNFPVALEGALKLKEISYVHAEGYPAAEMKHGPIAMIDEKTPTVFVIPTDSLYEKTFGNLEEIKARKGPIIAIATEGNDRIATKADEVIHLPATIEPLNPLLAALPLQLLAYHIAVARGCDVDKPRNLAKSVTVE